MVKMKTILLFTTVILASVLADVPVPTIQPAKIDPEPKPDTTTHVPDTTTSATTTSKPTTTSATTTTPKTTTSQTTTASTTKMTTTASPVTTTTMKPTPKPKPETLDFNVTDPVKNITCIMLRMEGVFHIPYNMTHDGKNVTVANATVIIPKQATATGTCGDDKQIITVSWSYNNKDMDKFTVTFAKNVTAKKFMISDIDGVIFKNDVEFVNATDNTTVKFAHKHADFVTPLSMSYKCKRAEYLNLTMEGKAVGQFVISDLQVQAFRNTTATKFSTAEDCEPFETSGIVPIAVGCSLVVLIVIVLIAYLIGRRRSQARGYLSMFSDRQREDEYIPMKNLSSCFGH